MTEDKTYAIETMCAPLDMLSEGPAGEHWYRIPSWRVTFQAEALAGLDLRVHRGLGHEGIWTLTEASTGCRLYDGWDDEPEDTADDMLAEFVAVYLPKLNKDMVEKAVVKAREMLSSHAPSPFVRPEVAGSKAILDPSVYDETDQHRTAAPDLRQLDSLYSNTMYKTGGGYRVYMNIEQHEFWTEVNRFFSKRQTLLSPLAAKDKA